MEMVLGLFLADISNAVNLGKNVREEKHSKKSESSLGSFLSRRQRMMFLNLQNIM
jgi:hypothetical protein